MINRVRRRVQLRIRSDERPTSDPDVRDVEDYAIEIKEDLFAQYDVISIVTVERGLDPKPWPGMGNECT
jgi:hypothetical protein